MSNKGYRIETSTVSSYNKTVSVDCEIFDSIEAAIEYFDENPEVVVRTSNEFITDPTGKGHVLYLINQQHKDVVFQRARSGLKPGDPLRELVKAAKHDRGVAAEILGLCARTGIDPTVMLKKFGMSAEDLAD